MDETQTLPLDEVRVRVDELINDASQGRVTVVTREGIPIAQIAPARPLTVPRDESLLGRAERLRERILPGESAAEMVRQARREAGRT
jgi:antitoxin (DNA-binding transcriptional repressor) of toxin-antitoxin stability system